MRGRIRTMKLSSAVAIVYLVLLSLFGRHHAHGHYNRARAFVVIDCPASKGHDGGIIRLSEKVWSIHTRIAPRLWPFKAR